MERIDTRGRLAVEYHNLLEKAAQYGLPVKFLRIVEQNVNMVSTGVNDVQYNSALNMLSLHEPSMRAGQELDPSAESYSTSNIPTNLYHESTHAWFDLMSGDSEVARFVAEQVAYYTGAPDQSGEATSEPYRLFMEAAATYVEHRVQNWWFALKWLSFGVKDRLIDDAFVADTRQKYNTAMAKDVFGYSYRWILALPPSREQTATTRPVSLEFRRFMDEQLLEGKIPDHFDEVALFSDMIGKAAVAPAEEAPAAEPLQRNATRKEAAPWIAPAEVETVLATPGAPIDEAVRQELEPRFGRSFENVRAHTDAAADTAARAVAARAFTSGSHLVFAAGQYAPQTSEGRRLLAHELTHVVQQGSARTARSFGSEDDSTSTKHSIRPKVHAPSMIQRTPRVANMEWPVHHGDVSQGNAIDLLAVGFADMGLVESEGRRLAEAAAQRAQWPAKRDLYVRAIDFLRDNRGNFDVIGIAGLISRVLDFCDGSSATAQTLNDPFYESLLVSTIYSAGPGDTTFTHSTLGSVRSLPGRPAGATDFAPSGTDALRRPAQDRGGSVTGGFSPQTDLLVSYGALSGGVAAGSVRLMLDSYTSRIPSRLRSYLETLATDPTIFSVIQRFLGTDGGRFLLQPVNLGGAHYTPGRPPSIEVDPRIMPGPAATPGANIDFRTTLAHELYHYALDRTDAAVTEIGGADDHRLIDVIEDRYRITELIRVGLPPIRGRIGALEGWVGGDKKPLLERYIRENRTAELRAYVQTQNFLDSLVFTTMVSAVSGNEAQLSGLVGTTADFLFDPAQLNDLAYLAAINAVLIRRALKTAADTAETGRIPLSTVWTNANYQSAMTSFISTLIGRASHNRSQGIAAISAAI